VDAAQTARRLNWAQVLSTISLNAPTLTNVLEHVLSFAADGSKRLVYATPDAADANKVVIMFYDGNAKYPLRYDQTGEHYLLAIDTFDGDTYVAVSVTRHNVAYIYKNPVSQIQDPRLGIAVPQQAFTIKQPTYASISDGGQYIVFEAGQRFAVYDADNQQGFNYTLADQLDMPQTHAAWMDSARLYYVSQGQLVVFDYDGQNHQVLTSADPRYPLAFDDNYKVLYSLVQSADNNAQELLTSTSLRTTADQ